MKLTDGIFHQSFKEVAKDYPDIITESYIIDIGAAMLATHPQKFDVIVTENLYGDIISDIVAQVTGSVGLAGSVNIGNEYAMFEAVHGSAPDIAGKGIANPSGLLNAAIYMLSYIGQKDIAQKIYTAWKKTIDDGIHTADIYDSKYSKKKVGTKEFTQKVINNLNNKVENVTFCNFIKTDDLIRQEKVDVQKVLIGVDIFLDWQNYNINELIETLAKLELTNDLVLGEIKSKGNSIWPEKPIATNSYSDNLCCRFLIKSDNKITNNDVNHLLVELEKNNIEVIKIEKLYIFGDKPGFSM
jgi:isocitrate dehydrogenase